MTLPLCECWTSGSNAYSCAESTLLTELPPQPTNVHMLPYAEDFSQICPSLSQNKQNLSLKSWLVATASFPTKKAVGCEMCRASEHKLCLWPTHHIYGRLVNWELNFILLPFFLLVLGIRYPYSLRPELNSVFLVRDGFSAMAIISISNPAHYIHTHLLPAKTGAAFGWFGNLF